MIIGPPLRFAYAIPSMLAMNAVSAPSPSLRAECWCPAAALFGNPATSHT
jgi:hypothetical protein